MLETVLAIGKAFRESPTGLKHHRYVESCPLDTDKRKILRLSLQVNKDFNFDIDSIKEIIDENIIRDKLFFNKFKTSDADGLVKYIFGDIYYSLSKGAEGGYYRLGDPQNKQKAFQISSFLRGREDFKSIQMLFEDQLRESNISEEEIKAKMELFPIKRFRDQFEQKIAFIENLLRYQCGVAEFLDLTKEGHLSSWSEFLSNETELRRLSALRIFKTIKGSRGAKKIFRELFHNENPDDELIMSSPENIQKLIDYSTSDLFLHFDFDGKHWYQFAEEFDIINKKILEDFAEQSKVTDGYILKKFIYKTLSSPEKDWQFPNFEHSKRHRSRSFRDTSDILDLLYAIDYSKTALLRIKYTDIKIIVLPKGNNLASEHYEKFATPVTALHKEQEKERLINQENIKDAGEQLFAPLIENIAEEITQFDLIFSKQGGQTSPDADLIELAGIEKSHLQEIDQRIGRIRRTLHDKRQNEVEAELKPFSIEWSFFNILGDSTSEMKKYQSHLYRVLPQIYTASYHGDAILLPALIEKTETNIRAGQPNFNLLKYDFYFLTSIQNKLPEGGILMLIQESQSYKIGVLLGKLAQNFAGQNSPIKSFEKSYVGNLSRRISTLADLIRFKTFIEEKLVIHEKNYEPVRATSLELAKAVKEFTGSYDKNECAFGFFESYFAPFGKKENRTSTDVVTL